MDIEAKLQEELRIIEERIKTKRWSSQELAILMLAKSNILLGLQKYERPEPS